MVCRCGLHNNLGHNILCYKYCVSEAIGVLSRVTFDVDHLFVVVFGCGPMINLSRSFCCMGVGDMWGRVLLLSRVTFDVVNHLFLWFKGVSCKLSYLMYCGGDWMSEGVSECVGMSCGCLGRPLML